MKYIQNIIIIYIVIVVIIYIVIVIIHLTTSRTGGPVRKAQRWLPPCHQQRPNAKPRIQHIRHNHKSGLVRVQLGTSEKVCTPVSQNDVGRGSSPILTDNQALETSG